jgi:hypothetical protein
MITSGTKYLCWCTICSRWNHPPSSQCFSTDMVYKISMFLLLSLGQYLCWWTISPRWNHPPRPVVRVSVLTWFIRYLCFYYDHWFGTSAGGLLVPDGIIHPVVSVSVLTWFIRYLCFYYYHWVGTSACGLLVPDGIIHPVVSVSVLTWTDYWEDDTLGD